MSKYDFNDNTDLNVEEDLYEAIAMLTGLYTDKIHLIYELLQNAEDCHAKQVKFIMHRDRMEMWHDGEPFTAGNLTAIRRINRSMKADKLNAIGKFGVGFKSVFSICETVEIYSAPDNYTMKSPDWDCLPRFSVRIDGFRLMSEIKSDKTIAKPFTTCFVFPFAVRENNAGKDFLGYRTEDDLRKAISSKLRSLGADIMLFLKNINKILYKLENGAEGSYELKKDNVIDGGQWITSRAIQMGKRKKGSAISNFPSRMGKSLLI